ncbi:MAG TPA: hypothetical protein VIH89_14395 [Candidatus Sulfotelmatobacter sp.]
MKKVFLLIVLPALMVALGFAQTPAASGNTDPTNIQGCLGGSDGNYTVAEDNTGQTFKITTSSVDLKPHLGHEVKLVGQKTIGAMGSGTGDNSLAVTEVNMISEHCVTAAAVPAATVSTTPETVTAPTAPPTASVSAPSETAVTPAPIVAPPADTAITPAPVATPPAETVVTPAPVVAPPAETAVTPAAPATPPAETVVTPAAVATLPADTVVPPVAAAHPTPSAQPRKRSATPAAAAAALAEPVSTPVAAATPPAAPVSTTSDTASAPAAAVTTPTVTHKNGSLWLIPAVVLLLILGIMVPLVNKWRKQKLLDQTSGENLSLTQEAVPVVEKSQGKSEGKTDVRKAA